MARLIEVYLVYVVLSAISVCIQITHIIEQFVYVIKYPVLEMTDSGYKPSHWFQIPEKSALI